MNVRYEGNRLFLGDEEIREWACHQEGGPAHYVTICCVAQSPTGRRLVSVDQSGKLKVWEPSRSRLERRVWYGNLAGEICAVGITDDGKKIAVARGLVVTVYAVTDGLVELERVLLRDDESPFHEQVASLQWLDDNRVACIDKQGKEGVIERQPLWKLV